MFTQTNGQKKNYHSPGCPSPTLSDVKRKLLPCSMSNGIWPFTYPFVNDVSGILNLVLSTTLKFVPLILVTVEKRPMHSLEFIFITSARAVAKSDSRTVRINTWNTINAVLFYCCNSQKGRPIVPRYCKQVRTYSRSRNLYLSPTLLYKYKPNLKTWMELFNF